MAEPIDQTDGKRTDQIWSFRGYRLSPGEFNTAMVHFYRAEVTRSNTWRTRLDATTNWAVVATGAALSFAFSTTNAISHIMIPLNTMLITLFLLIEARRYRYYELWAYRVRLMETDFFAAMLAPPFQPSETWSSRLASNLLDPSFTITFWEAFGRRFRRNYQFIFALLAVAWSIKIAIHPDVATSWQEFLGHATVGPIPGTLVLFVGLLFNTTIFAIGWLTAGLQESKGEVLRKTGVGSPLDLLQTAGDAIAGYGLHLPTRHEEMAYVITARSNAEMVSQEIFRALGRGVTGVEGKGMYSGEAKIILFVAIHPDQVVHLKNIVRDVDPGAFVIIQRAQEVVGRGFHAPS